MRLIHCLLFFFFALGGATVGASAAELARHEASHSVLKIDSEQLSMAPGGSTWLALTILPREGWHTYWQNPGDSGAQPILSWQLPEGASITPPLYPVPHRLPVGPLMNYGYDGRSALLVKLTTPPAQGNHPATLNAEWLVCEIECVPQFATLDIEIKVDDARRDPGVVNLFSDARAALPEPSFWDADLLVQETRSLLQVYMSAEETADIVDAYFFAEGEGLTDYAAKQEWQLNDNGLVLTLLRHPGMPEVTSSKGVLTLNKATKNLSYSIDSQLKIETNNIDPVQMHNAMPVWRAAIFALIGGLILNLMPCVFPVLSLKAFAFVSANYKTAANRRKEGWAYTLGIWASFMAIVGLLLVLRAGGSAIGWGFQLQEPVFVALMTLLMLVVGLSLSGLFNIQFGIESAGESLASREGVTGAFFKGVLAALVATPCTAPFMAPAIGYALTQPILIVFIIFSALALGLALPFLALAYIPALARAMPRQGAWMEKLKEALAFPMYLTAAWLLYIFDRQVGAIGTFMLVVAMVAIAFALWLIRQGNGKTTRGLAIIIGVGALIGIANEPWIEPKRDAEITYTQELAYSPAALAEVVGQDAPVFVYFTADWCITCKVNERIAIETEATQAAFIASGTIVMKGDWTNRNEEIANVLTQYGRAGVPLYLFFPKGQREAKVLPEVLGPGTISNLLAVEAE